MLPGQGVGNLVSLRRNQDTASRHDAKTARSAPEAREWHPRVQPDASDWALGDGCKYLSQNYVDL